MENNFENKIRAALENQPFIPFDERAWRAMEKQMDTPYSHNSWKRTGLFSILGLLLLGLGICIGHWSNIPFTTTTKQIVIIDTIFQRHQTVVYDTIYSLARDQYFHSEGLSPKNLNLTERYQSKQRARISTSALRKVSIFFDPSPFNTQLKASEHYQDYIYKNPFSSINISIQPDKIQTQLKANTISFSPHSIEKQETLLPKTILLPITMTKKSLAYYLDHIIPKHYGLFTKFSIQHDFELSFDDDSQASQFHQGGIEVFMNRHLSILATFGNHITTFEKEAGNDFNLNGFPAPSLEEPDHFVSHAQAKFDLELLAFGFNYHLRSEKKIQPYFGLGLYASRALDARIDYRIARPNNGFYEIRLDDLLPDQFKIDSYWLQAGNSYAIGKHWRISLDINARLGLKKGDYKYESPKALGLNLGLGYFW